MRTCLRYIRAILVCEEKTICSSLVVLLYSSSLSSMLAVLDHRALTPKPSLLSFTLCTLTALCLLSSALTCAAQKTINGQTYTNGLSIINSPAQNSDLHAGSNIGISIEVSGNGKLPMAALVPNSNLATSYQLLEIYLVSYGTGLNLTVSSGIDLLTRESGTVRHHDFFIPSCVPPGQYNLTLYETSFINSISHYTITPIPVKVLNSAGSLSSCSNGVNELQPQPQASSDFGRSPFDPNQSFIVATTPLDDTPAMHTVTKTSIPASGTTTTKQNISSPTTTSPSEGSVTLVIVSQVTSTITEGSETITTNFMTTRTTVVPLNTQGSSGFIPINASKPRLDPYTCIFIPILLAFWVITIVLKGERY